MPKTITLLRLFIASPNDVKDERQIIKNVVDELNITFSSNKNIQIEVVGWETHTYPSIGLDAQDVINNQIKDDYDIFVGVMWSRFGSPTNRDTSGTKEEFERAYSRNLVTKELSMLFYFKNAPIPFDDINPDQITKIKQFKEDLSNRGLLYGHFTQTDEFEKIFRLNLTQLVNDFSKNQSNTVLQATTLKKDSEIISKSPELDIRLEDEELGMFDYLDNAEHLMKDVEVTLSKIVKNMNDLTSKMHKKTMKLGLLSTKPLETKTRDTRKLIDLIAEDMLIFNQRTKFEISVLNDQFSSAIKNYNNALLIYNTLDAESEEKQKILDSLSKLKIAITESMEGLDSMKISVLDTPALTSKYAKAKKETIKLLTEITDDFSSYVNMTDELEKIID